ncbi:MAG: hypothetical protein E6819_03795, partial [Staphylococcus epidermidis]|nr:hypothetical protein [Staphylococcus epidermidis]
DIAMYHLSLDDHNLGIDSFYHLYSSHYIMIIFTCHKHITYSIYFTFSNDKIQFPLHVVFIVIPLKESYRLI